MVLKKPSRFHLFAVMLMGLMVSVGMAGAKDVKKPTPAIPATVLPATNGLVSDMMLGNPNAKVTIIEYASTSCPHCADWYHSVYPYIEQTYIRSGKVRLIYREVMTSPQQYALSSYLIGRCLVAKNPKKDDASAYFTVIDTFFDEQETFYKTGKISSALAAVSAKTGQS
jgi:protein-disulfide isomerase